MTDAYVSVVFCSQCRKIATIRHGRIQYKDGLVVCWPDCNESPYIRALIAWADRTDRALQTENQNDPRSAKTEGRTDEASQPRDDEISMTPQPKEHNP